MSVGGDGEAQAGTGTAGERTWGNNNWTPLLPQSNSLWFLQVHSWPSPNAPLSPQLWLLGGNRLPAQVQSFEALNGAFQKFLKLVPPRTHRVTTPATAAGTRGSGEARGSAVSKVHPLSPLPDLGGVQRKRPESGGEEGLLDSSQFTSSPSECRSKWGPGSPQITHSFPYAWGSEGMPGSLVTSKLWRMIL